MKKLIPHYIVVPIILFIAFCELSQVNLQMAFAVANHKHQLSITITNPATQNLTILTNFITLTVQLLILADRELKM
jgi:hypothetical protein